MMMTLSEIEQTIKAGLPDAHVQVLDPMNDGVHLAAVIVSPSFDGLNRIKQHQLVYKALGDAFSGPLHALQLKTMTPTEFEEMKEE